jgi:MFS family permease
MPQNDLAHAFDHPIVIAVLALVGVALLAVFVRELVRMPRSLLALTATAFLDMVGLLMVGPLLPFYVQELHDGGDSLFGLPLEQGTLNSVMVAAFTAAQLIAAPWWGRFSDHRGRRPTLLIALAGSVVGYLGFGFAGSLLVLLLTRLVQGAGGGTVGVIQAYVADATAPQDRARALGWLSAATNLGVALGPVLGTFALNLGEQDLAPGDAEFKIGRAAPGLFAALLCALTMLFAWRYLPESRGHSQRARRPWWEAIWHVVARAGQPSSRLIWTYAIAIGSFQGTNAVLAYFLKAHFGVTKNEIGWFYLYIGAISVFTRLLALGPLVDRLGEARLSRIGIVTLAAGLIGLPFAGSLPTLALAVAMLPLGTAFTFPCVTALLSRVVAAEERGLYMGMQQTFGGMMRVVMPLLYGILFDCVGVDAPYFVAGALVLSTITLGFGFGAIAPKAKAGAAAGT